jgi:SAM-dependent methyltransferase
MGIGFPYFVLTTTNPLLQGWIARSKKQTNPFRLFAVSSTGSLLGLLSYPLLIEPLFSVRTQVLIWSVAYFLFCLLCIPLIRLQMVRRVDDGVDISRTEKRTLIGKTSILFAGCGSALLCAITNHLTQNIAPIPLLWVLPLAVYLCSYIVSFYDRLLPSRESLIEVAVVALVAMAYGLTSQFENTSLYLLVSIYVLGLFVCCLFCHAELARQKPAADGLTSYYLMISLGGFLGGFCVCVLAPLLFNSFLELPILLCICAGLVFFALFFEVRGQTCATRKSARLRLLGIFVVGYSLTIAHIVNESLSRAKVLERNFYGSLRVVEARESLPTGTRVVARTLQNGSIDHGVQFLEATRRRTPTSYYGAKSGVGIALQTLALRGSLRVGIVGLGVGTLAAYGRAGDFYRFYEINPLVVDLAKREFTFLSDSHATIKITLGDARHMLESEPSQEFDLLAVDAFSGDAVPVHLLTREAFLLYVRHLKPSGVLAIHTSNRYLDLQSVVLGVAESLGLQSRLVHDKDDPPNRIYASDWILVAKQNVPLRALSNARDALAQGSTKRIVWTDDFSSLMSALY